MTKNKNKLLLFTIILIASMLRLWNLGNIPPHLTPDEASLGYNAYSILKTGRDEYGSFLPIVFKSFGDYKPGLYIYTIVPFITVLGLNEWAVRLPSAFAGVISVILIFLIVKKLFKDTKLVISNSSTTLTTISSQIAIGTAALAAINPWLIYFSRGAWEVNLSLTLTLLGIYIFLKSFTKPWLIVLSSLSFALTLITYQGAKLSTGIVVVLLGVIYWSEARKLFSLKRSDLLRLALAGAVGLAVSTPIILSLFQGKAGRLEVFSVFSYPRPTEYLQRQLAQGGENIGGLSYYLFHSEALNFTRGIIGRWFNHFSSRFLFFEGDWSNPRHSAPNSGVLIIADLILLLAGFISLIKIGSKKEVWLIILWLILAPLPAILSRDQVHAVRSLNMAIPLMMIGGIGMMGVTGKIRQIKKPLLLTTFYLLLAIIYMVNYSYFLDAYFVHLSKHSSQLWEYGYKQIVETVTPIQSNYKTVKIQQSYAQPYIYFLFYQQYDPVKYQKQAKLKESQYGDVGQVEHLDNIYFAPIDWSINRGDHGTLIVADPIRIPPEDSKDTSQFKLISEIKYLNGVDIAFRVIEVK